MSDLFQNMSDIIFFTRRVFFSIFRNETPPDLTVCIFGYICNPARLHAFGHNQTKNTAASNSILNQYLPMTKITVKDTEVNVVKINGEDYICLTDMLRAKDGDFFITDWLRNRNTLEFLGIWEKVYNPAFNYGEFAIIKSHSGLNSFKISVKEFVARTNAISLQAKAGRYGGTYAHHDIAFEFAMWISPEFKVYIVKEFQRLKAEEQQQIGWSARRELSKINYRIHTDAIKQNLIPAEVTSTQANIIYANEADVLNVAMFGMTAKQWREAYPGMKGNIRDYATINELICLSNMENLNAVFIEQGMPQGERLVKLNQIAIHQMKVLESDGTPERQLLK